ncbi:hypothetical protein AM469_003293, partial [Pseudomonas aeruginosa]
DRHLSVTLPSLAAVGLLVWFIVAPLRKLTRWSMTLDDLAPDSQRPRFNYRELNVLADTPVEQRDPDQGLQPARGALPALRQP